MAKVKASDFTATQIYEIEKKVTQGDKEALAIYKEISPEYLDEWDLKNIARSNSSGVAPKIPVEYPTYKEDSSDNNSFDIDPIFLILIAVVIAGIILYFKWNSYQECLKIFEDTATFCKFL